MFYVGMLIGALIPVATFFMSHYQSGPIGIGLTLAGLAFSAPTVYQWGLNAFKSPVKSIGFVVLLEGIMTLSTVPYLPVVCLIYLVSINAVQTGFNVKSKPMVKATRAKKASKNVTKISKAA